MGRIWPGSLAANASRPGPPIAVYSVMKSVPPATARPSAPMKPPCWPPADVEVCIWIAIDIHDSCPDSAKTLSFGCMLSSSTGITVPTILVSIFLAPAQEIADKRAAPRLSVGQVFLDRVRQMLHGHGLQPHLAGTSEGCEKDAVPPKERVLDARDRGDAELDRVLVHTDVTRVDPQDVPRLEVVRDDLAAQLNPGLALARQPLHSKPRPAQQPGAESLLEAHGELDAGGGAHEPVPVHQVSGGGSDLHRQDLAGQLRREREQARSARRRVLGHEPRTPGDGTAQGAHETALLATGGGRRLHLDRHRHPGQLTRLGIHLVAGLHAELEHGQHCANDLWLHRCPPSKTVAAASATTLSGACFRSDVMHVLERVTASRFVAWRARAGIADADD